MVPRALTQTSKQLREETIIQFYSRNAFHVSIHHFDEGLEKVQPYAKHIRFLYIGLACPYHNPWTSRGTLEVLPVAKFLLQHAHSECRVWLLSSCAHKAADGKCRTTLLSIGLISLRSNFSRGSRKRSGTRPNSMLVPCSLGGGKGSWWLYAPLSTLSGGDLMLWDAYIHYIVQNQANMLSFLTVLTSPWRPIIEGDMLSRISFWLAKDRWCLEGNAGSNGPTIKGQFTLKLDDPRMQLGIKLQEIMDDLRCEEGQGWKKLKASKTRKLKTEDWIDTPWRNDWNPWASLGYGGKSLIWMFCCRTDSSRTNRALKHLQLE